MDKVGRGIMLLSFTDHALTKKYFFDEENERIKEIFLDWKKNGITVIREDRQDVATGTKYLLSSVQVPYTDKDAWSAIRLWSKQQNYIDYPLTDEMMRCAKLILKTALLPEERAALIQGFTRLNSDELAEVEKELKTI